MKKFSLICENAHEFEGWFADAQAIADQCGSGLLDCPVCSSTDVRKQLSAPNLATPKTRARYQPEAKDSDTRPAGKTMPQMAGPAAAAPSAALRSALRQLQKTIETEFTDVGDNFAIEARKIHYGDKEPDNIYGTCSTQESQELIDEGVDIAPLPWLPPEH